MRNFIIASICFASIFISCEDIDDSYLDDSTTVTPNEDEKVQNISQNKWIYEKMKHHYLWNNEIPDSLALDFSSHPNTFFPSLLSPSDRFSWIEVNESYTRSESYGALGITWQEYVGCKGERLCRVLQVDKNSPASRGGMKRGDWFIGDVQGRVITLGRLDDQYSFASTRNLVIQEEEPEVDEVRYSVSVDSVYVVENHKIGYFVYDSFVDSSSVVDNPYRLELRDLISDFKSEGIDNLIVDLRYNRGGALSICQYLSTLMLPDEYLGTTYGYNEYNDIIGAEREDATGEPEERLSFYGSEDIYHSNIGLDRIYVILTGDSFSASEAFTLVLSPIIDVVHVGTTSGGKGVGSYSIANNLYEYQIQPITFRYYNREHETVPDSGLIPSIYADESTEKDIYELGDMRELLLSTAIDDILGVKETKSLAAHRPQLPFTPIEVKRSKDVDIKGYTYEQY